MFGEQAETQEQPDEGQEPGEGQASTGDDEGGTTTSGTASAGMPYRPSGSLARRTRPSRSGSPR